MAGRGVISEAHKIYTQHVMVLRNGRFLHMFRPVNPDREFSGVCLAESFAEACAKKYGCDVGLIPCADGGTKLEQWKKGSVLYDNAVYQTKLAMRSSTVAGILWHQGESDCYEHLAATYKERFNEMISSLKSDLGLDVPVLVGGLGDFLKDYIGSTDRSLYIEVNKQLKSIAADDERIGFVSAEGLKGKEDNLHFNSDALYEFGLRYFDEFEKINNNVYLNDKFEKTELSEMEKL
jgi:hypothetical protein